MMKVYTMKLLSIQQSPTLGSVSAKIEKYGQVLDMIITGQFMWECEVGYLMECENVSNVEFIEGESLTFTVTDGDTSVNYEFARLYL